MQTNCNKKNISGSSVFLYIIKILAYGMQLKQDESEGFLQSTTLLKDFIKAKAFCKALQNHTERACVEIGDCLSSALLHCSCQVRTVIQVTDISLQFRWHNELLWKIKTDSMLKCTSFNSVCLFIIVLILTLCAYSRLYRLGILQSSVQRIEEGFGGAGS